MARLVFNILLSLALFAPSVQAGAWLRETATSFTSISFTTNYFGDIGNSAYLEYGLREDLTFGADVGNFTNRFGSNTGVAMFFIRRPLGLNEGANRWAYELGVGAAWQDESIVPLARTSLLWGRGIKVSETSGWMGVDVSAIWDFSGGLYATKVDATVGLNFTDNTMGILQLYLSNQNGRTFSTLAPSVVVSPGKSKVKYQVGLESLLQSFDDTSIKLGIWREF